MKKVFAFLVLFMLMNSFPAYAESSRVDIKVCDFRYFSISEDKIIGSFEVENTTNFHEEDLFYTISLIPHKLIEENEGLYSSYVTLNRLGPVGFSLSSYEKKTIAFEYPLPANLCGDTYTLMLDFFDKTSSFPQNTTINKIALENTETGFLIPSDYSKAHYYDIQNYESPLSGPYFNIGSSPDAFINLQSTFEKNVTAYPKFTVYKRQQSFLPKAVKEVTGDAITFSPETKKTVQLTLPQMDEPDSYLVKVVLVDDLGIPISCEYYFRYVVNGASAKIAYISTSYSNDTKELTTNIGFFGSADSSVLENTTFSYTISESDTRKIIAGANVPLTLYSVPYNLGRTDLLGNTGVPIGITAQITYGGKTLAYENIILDKKATEKSVENPLKDVEGLPCERQVKMLHALGIISNYPDGTFRPSSAITRAEFTAIVAKLKNISEYTETELTPFKDVSAEHWASKLIATAYRNDIIHGYGDGTFRPNNNVTYAEALTMLLNVSGFKDAASSMSEPWPVNYISFANQINLLKNIPIDSFNIPAERGSMAIITLATYIIGRM